MFKVTNTDAAGNSRNSNTLLGPTDGLYTGLKFVYISFYFMIFLLHAYHISIFEMVVVR